MCFAVIAVADNLSSAEIVAASEAGPPYVAAGSTYSELMATAGFEHTELIEVSGEYRATLRAWVREWDVESIDLGRVVGCANFAEQQRNRRRAIDATRKGLLRRYVISAARP